MESGETKEREGQNEGNGREMGKTAVKKNKKTFHVQLSKVTMVSSSIGSNSFSTGTLAIRSSTASGSSGSGTLAGSTLSFVAPPPPPRSSPRRLLPWVSRVWSSAAPLVELGVSFWTADSTTCVVFSCTPVSIGSSFPPSAAVTKMQKAHIQHKCNKAPAFCPLSMQYFYRYNCFNHAPHLMSIN